MTLSQENFFKPEALTANSPATSQDTVRAILAAEAAARDEKTRKLREARLGRQLLQQNRRPEKV